MPRRFCNELFVVSTTCEVQRVSQHSCEDDFIECMLVTLCGPARLTVSMRDCQCSKHQQHYQLPRHGSSAFNTVNKLDQSNAVLLPDVLAATLLLPSTTNAAAGERIAPLWPPFAMC